jgi:hypothetical protein
MQYAVPQFTDVEDKLIGPLTLKQFLILLGFGGIIFFLWSVFNTNPIFFITAGPLAIMAGIITFKKLNNRPLYAFLLPLIFFVASPKMMVFQRQERATNFVPKEIKKEAPKKTEGAVEEPFQSRLKNLAYLLDYKTEQEKKLINAYEQQLLNPEKTAVREPEPTIVKAAPKIDMLKTKEHPKLEALKRLLHTTSVKEKGGSASRTKPARKAMEKKISFKESQNIGAKEKPKTKLKPVKTAAQPKPGGFDPSDILSNYGNN